MSARTDRLHAELMALRDDAGLIDARSAVKWARRNRTSQLYRELEWDNTVAGEEYRIHQVRQLIAVEIIDGGGVRKLVSLSIDRSQGGGYRPIEEVGASPNLRAILLRDALGELNRVKERFKRLSELAQVWAAADRVQKKVEAVQKKSGGRPRKKAA